MSDFTNDPGKTKLEWLESPVEPKKSPPAPEFSEQAKADHARDIAGIKAVKDGKDGPRYQPKENAQ